MVELINKEKWEEWVTRLWLVGDNRPSISGKYFYSSDDLIKSNKPPIDLNNGQPMIPDPWRENIWLDKNDFVWNPEIGHNDRAGENRKGEWRYDLNNHVCIIYKILA